MPLETLLARLLVDSKLRAEFLRDPRECAASLGFSGEELEALAEIDQTGLLLAADSFAAKRHQGRRTSFWRRIFGR